MKSPEVSPPGEAHKLRLTVQDEAAEALLARLTNPTVRPDVPDFLYVFSEQTYHHNTNDMYDGHSHNDLTLRSYKRKINDYNRSKFRAGENVNLDGRFLRLQVHLGIQAGARILVPPFYSSGPDTEMDVYYPIRGDQPVDEGLVNEIDAYMSERPPDVYDGLTVVTRYTAQRALYGRSKGRKNDILQV